MNWTPEEVDRVKGEVEEAFQGSLPDVIYISPGEQSLGWGRLHTPQLNVPYIRADKVAQIVMQRGEALLHQLRAELESEHGEITYIARDALQALMAMYREKEDG
jgi:hypothetical protein